MANNRYPEIVEGETGPNGHPVGYDDEHNYVEWIPHEDEEDGGVRFAMILRRNDDDIGKEYQRLWDKVWWNRHMSHCEFTNPAECPLHGPGCDPARALVDRYGLEFLDPGEMVEWGITQGKMMALAWVHGSDWESSGDT